MKIITSVAATSAIVALGLAVSLAAQQAPTREVPTKKNPLRFTAFNVSMQTGMAGVTDIVLERWRTDAERQMLLGLVETSTEGERGQQKLLRALQDIKQRVGFIRTPNSIGWDLKYAYEHISPDGIRQIVVVTDKPVGFAAAASGSRVLDYPFTLIEMRMKDNDKGEKGEGKMLAASSISTKNGKLEIENYGQQPVQLTQITEKQKKPKT